jgi:hypothetical protein
VNVATEEKKTPIHISSQLSHFLLQMIVVCDGFC